MLSLFRPLKFCVCLCFLELFSGHLCILILEWIFFSVPWILPRLLCLAPGLRPPCLLHRPRWSRRQPRLPQRPVVRWVWRAAHQLMAALPDGDEVIVSYASICNFMHGIFSSDLPEVGDVYGLKFGMWQDHPSTYKRGMLTFVQDATFVQDHILSSRRLWSAGGHPVRWRLWTQITTLSSLHQSISSSWSSSPCES